MHQLTISTLRMQAELGSCTEAQRGPTRELWKGQDTTDTINIKTGFPLSSIGWICKFDGPQVMTDLQPCWNFGITYKA